MLTFRIEWPSDFGPNYSVYTGYRYIINGIKNGDVKVLIIYDRNDEEKYHDITLGKGARMFVMNSAGATIDKFYMPIDLKPVDLRPQNVPPISDAPWDHGNWSNPIVDKQSCEVCNKAKKTVCNCPRYGG